MRSLLKSLGCAAAVFTVLGGYRPTRAVEPTPRPNGADRFWRELAIQDWICLLYLATLLAFTIAGEGPRRPQALVYLSLDTAIFFITLVLSRAKVLRGMAAALAYRMGLFAAVFGSFSHLQYVLPTARATTVDAELYAFDVSVFQIEPALMLDWFVTEPLTEWFSFFYFSYFFILASHILPFMFGTTKRFALLAEFSLGVIALFCIGQLFYIVVPGYGPYHHLADQFAHPLDGPIWWRLVKTTVDSVEVSARTDIFPSLHTAVPTYFALFAIRHRKASPFRYTWLPLTFAASQIVISTMYLRWHYLSDVIAGLILAFEVALYAGRIAHWEAKRRELLRKSPIWNVMWEPDGLEPDALAKS